MATIPVIALTPGEPAGVGPDLAIQIAQQPPACALVVIADPALLVERAKLLRLPFTAREWKRRDTASHGVYVLPVKTARAVSVGRLD
ncbi:MAG: 4-hydroxythreonine-4-phosphate dehydrogenase, partial [Gammaproteobacteria bacterium]|nr:4-hydroxythreonine-4-phosphate dehydrogenase [Gammaproteobacteria bacterium]